MTSALQKTAQDKLGELQALELQILATKNLSPEEAASFAYLLEEQDQAIALLSHSALEKHQWIKELEKYQDLSKKMWEKIDKISPVTEQPVLDPSDWASIDRIAREGLKMPVKPAPSSTMTEVPPPIPDKAEQLLPNDDEIDWLLDDAAIADGMNFEKPTVKPSSSGSTTTSTTASTGTTTTPDLPVIVQIPEKQFTATLRNTNPAAGHQICMQFISEFTRFLRDQSQLNLESIIGLGNEIYKTKDILPEKLHCLGGMGVPDRDFAPTKDGYLTVLNALDKSRNGFKGGPLPIIGAVLTSQGTSIAIVIALKNKQPFFHIFCPDGNAKLQETPKAFRKEYATKEEAADYLAQMHASMTVAPVKGSMHTFIRKQDFKLDNTIKKSGSGSSTQSSTAPVLPPAEKTASSSSSSQSTVSGTIPVLSPTGPATHYDYAKKLIAIQQELAYSEKPSELAHAFQGLQGLKAKTKDLSSIGSLVLIHLYCIHRKIPGKVTTGYSMASAFQNKSCTTTPRERHLAFNHAILEVLLDGLEAAYQAQNYIAAQSYVNSIADFCKTSNEASVKESFPLLQTICSWRPTLQLSDRITHIGKMRQLLKQEWGMK